MEKEIDETNDARADWEPWMHEHRAAMEELVSLGILYRVTIDGEEYGWHLTEKGKEIFVLFEVEHKDT